MTQPKTVQALEKGIRVLEVLQGAEAATLHELRDMTGMPKSTLRRLLATLEAAGVVWRGLGDGLYRANVNLRRIPTDIHAYDYLIEAALPVLRELSHQQLWPSDLFVRSGAYMRVIETTRGYCVMSLTRELMGEHVSMELSASGRAYLAFCGDSERADVLAQLDDLWPETAQERRTDLQYVIEETRARGYALRDERYCGGTRAKPGLIDGLSAIAVPIMEGGGVHGCINRVWPWAAMSRERFVAENLESLQRTAEEISRNLKKSA